MVELLTMSTHAALLAIDDEPDVLAIVAQFAQRFGFAVVTRTDARAALAELRGLKPDAVLVDLMMPDINGLDVAAAGTRAVGGILETDPP